MIVKTEEGTKTMKTVFCPDNKRGEKPKQQFSDIKYLESKYMDNKFNEIQEIKIYERNGCDIDF